MAVPPRILVIEDNSNDFALLAEAVAETGDGAPRLVQQVDGPAALTWLRGEAADVGLIVLDLNLPKLHGSEVLAELRRDVATRRIPVAVLTSSSSAVDRARCRLADAFLTKPSTWAGCLEVARRLVAMVPDEGGPLAGRPSAS